MAKKDQLTLADLLEGQEKANLKMASAIESQLRAQLEIKKLAEQDRTMQMIQTAESIKQENDQSKLIEEIKEGLLDKTGDGLNSNVVKLAKSVDENTKSVQKSFGVKTTSDSNANDLSENDIENRKVQDREIQLLEIIAKNTAPKNFDVKEGDDKWNLGGWATALAIGLGAIVGVLKAQFKVMRDFLKLILPEFDSTKIKNQLAKIPEFFKTISNKLLNVVDQLGISIEFGVGKVAEFFKKSFPNAFESFSSVVSTVAEKLKTAFNFIKNGVISLSETFTSGFKLFTEIGPVTKAIESVKGFIGNIVRWVSRFAGVFKFVSVAVEKLAYPITVIMGIWDTVKGAIAGFKEGGIIGALQGGVTGLINSLVGSFLDTIKDMISWVLNLFGFDKISKTLDSFSFEDIITKFIDAFFSPIRLLKDIFDKAVGLFKAIEIPGISFELFGKKFEFGPWKPFSDGETPAPPTPEAQAKSDKKVEEGAKYKDVVGQKDTAPTGKEPAYKKALSPVAQKAPMTNIEESTSATLSGVTTDQIKAHPNYKKYFAEAKGYGESDGEAYEDAALQVKSDMAREKKVTPTAPAAKAANKVYNKSADNVAAATKPTAKHAPTVVNTTNQVNNQNQTAVIKTPVRNQDSTLYNYFKTRFSI